MEKTYFIGIDVSKNELDFAVVESKKTLFHIEVSNDKNGITDFMKQLKNKLMLLLKTVCFAWNLQESIITFY